MSGGAKAMSATKTFEQFVAAINDHDIEALNSLMTRTISLWIPWATVCRARSPCELDGAVTLRCAQIIGFECRIYCRKRKLYSPRERRAERSIAPHGRRLRLGRLLLAAGEFPNGGCSQTTSQFMKFWRVLSNSAVLDSDDSEMARTNITESAGSRKPTGC
jgi:hypothetical protein